MRCASSIATYILRLQNLAQQQYIQRLQDENLLLREQLVECLQDADAFVDDGQRDQRQRSTGDVGVSKMCI